MVKKKKKNDADTIQPVYVLQAWRIKLTFRALVFILCSLIIGTILIVNCGYNSSVGFYWKPANVKIDIQKEKRP